MSTSSRLEFLGSLAGGLAHEIKNPLSTLKLTLQLLEEDMRKNDSTLAKRSLRKVELLLREVGNMDEIVQNFLHFARGHDLKVVQTDLRELVVGLLEFLGEEARAKNIRLHFEDVGRLDGLVLDAKLLRQALLNLLKNSIEAIDARQGGEIIVRAQVKGDLVGIEVIDTGCGIAASNLDRMFRPYFTTKKGGTGMGLPMVRRIVEEHGGQITFESEEGQGARFLILLPVNPGKREALQAMVAVGRAGEKP